MLPLTAFALGVTVRFIDPAAGREGPLAALAGLAVALSYWHRYRGLGLAAIGSAGALVAGIIAAANGAWCSATIALATCCLTLTLIRLVLFLSASVRGTEYAAWGMLYLIGCGVAAVVGSSIGGSPYLWLPLAAGLLTVLSFRAFVRPTFELCCEPILWMMYRIRGVGPGLALVPLRGPCLVIANHASWFDPLFLAKVIPQPVTPMMTSRFFDLPVLHWLLTHIIPTIRVPDHHYRREDVPEEIRAAIAALDRGECIVLFPEGFLRRADEKPLRRFGRGVWQILRERPDTPVFACWIEGGWGSCFSYWNGKPTENKRPDIRRRISVAVSEPIALDPRMLAHHLTTRIALMNRVSEARGLLGLTALPPFELPKHEDEPLNAEGETPAC